MTQNLIVEWSQDYQDDFEQSDGNAWVNPSDPGQERLFMCSSSEISVVANFHTS